MEIEVTIKIKDDELLELFNRMKQEEMEDEEIYDPVSPHARFFDECSPMWHKDTDFEKRYRYNLMFLKQQQEYANHLLKMRGHLFLNEVYDMLGMPRSTDGGKVGWIYDLDNPVGDNFVDFGIFTPFNSEFINGVKPTALLDFNVDGYILDMIQKD